MTKIIKPLLRELQLRNCGFNHMPPEELVRSQWQSRTKNIYYLVYRWAIAIFFIGVVADSMSNLQSAQDWGLYFIYLTHWGILLCLITGIYGAIIVSKWYFHPEYSDQINESNEMPITFKIYWGLHNITLILSIIITIAYWSLLYTPSLQITAGNVLVHACNSIIMFIDMIIVAHPIKLWHVLQPILTGIVYCIFSVIFYAAGGIDRHGNPYIYDILDWTKPGTTIVYVILILLLVILVHIFIFIMFKLRLFIHYKFFDKNTIHPTTSSTSTLRTAPPAGISMVFGNGNNTGGYQNESFKDSTEKF